MKKWSLVGLGGMPPGRIATRGQLHRCVSGNLTLSVLRRAGSAGESGIHGKSNANMAKLSRLSLQ